MPDDGLPLCLSDWIARDGVRWFKLKLKGTDIEWHLQRIREVFRVAKKSLVVSDMKAPVQMTVDPNEACPNPAFMVELLRRLRESDLPAYRSLIYIEQPTPRNLSEYDYTLHEISGYKPVLIDESLDGLQRLEHVEALGWSGVALKTCKSQSHALLAYCWAKQRGLFATVQDLTNPGYALIQSANLCSRLSLSIDGFEYNSRQYAPFIRLSEQHSYEQLFRVSGGQIDLSQIKHKGLY